MYLQPSPFVSSLASAILLSSHGSNVVASENGHKPVFCFLHLNLSGENSRASLACFCGDKIEYFSIAGLLEKEIEALGWASASPAPLGLSGLRKGSSLRPPRSPRSQRGVWPAKLTLHTEGGEGLHPNVLLLGPCLILFPHANPPLVPGTREAWT